MISFTPGIYHAQALPLPRLTRIDSGTIGCQTAQAYTQWVPMHDPDQAPSVPPAGPCEWPDCAARISTLALWSEGRLHPAPLSWEKVEAQQDTATNETN